MIVIITAIVSAIYKQTKRFRYCHVVQWSKIYKR